MRKFKTILVPLLLMAAAVAMLFWNLENWMPHQENIFTLLAAPVLPVICIVQLWQGLRKKDALRVVSWGIALLVCGWVLRCRWSIPVCLECNGGVTPENLSWMARYFQ